MIKNKLTVTLLISLITGFVFLFYVLAFYPGYMSNDSAYHYAQLQSGEWTNFQPVIILLFWQLTETVVTGPGGLFLLFLFLYLAALFIISFYLQGGWLSRLVLLLIAIQPVNVMVFPHIWKDIGLLVFTLLAVALLLSYLHYSSLPVLVFSLISLWLAVLFRFEAVVSLLPLFGFQGSLWLSRHRSWSIWVGKARWRYGGFFIVFFAVLLLLILSSKGLLVRLTNSKPVTLWPTIGLWDIARVSVRENRQLLPEFVLKPGATVAQLEKTTTNWSNVSLFTNPGSGMRDNWTPEPTPQEFAIAFKVWVSLPFLYPESYFSHRLRLFSELLRINEEDNKPQGLFWVNEIVDYNEQFPVNKTPLNQWVNKQLIQYRDSILFKPWSYLLLALVILAYLLSLPRLSHQQRLASCLLYCCCLTLAVLFVFSPAAEQRYLLLLFNLIPLAACLTWAKQPSPTLTE